MKNSSQIRCYIKPSFDIFRLWRGFPCKVTDSTNAYAIKSKCYNGSNYVLHFYFVIFISAMRNFNDSTKCNTSTTNHERDMQTFRHITGMHWYSARCSIQTSTLQNFHASDQLIQNYTQVSFLLSCLHLMTSSNYKKTRISQLFHLWN